MKIKGVTIPSVQSIVVSVGLIASALVGLSEAVKSLKSELLGDAANVVTTILNPGPQPPDPVVSSLQAQIDSLRRYHE